MMLAQTQTAVLDGAIFSIHPSTHLQSVSLTVADLEQQLAFYQQVLGLSLHWREGNRAGLGAGEADLLQLVEQPGSKRYNRVTGLYHFALLYPDRHEFARAVARLFDLKIRNSPTDHIMTKSTYLDDPEGNGIELYSESPEDGHFDFEDGKFGAVRADGTLSDGREAMDLQALFNRLQPNDRLNAPISKQVRLGHVHLHVRDVDEALMFYHDVLGFDIMGHAAPYRVAFVSAGGYHHHIGMNTWQGAGAPPPPADAEGLRYFSITLPDLAALDAVTERIAYTGRVTQPYENGLLLHDPSENGVLLKVAGE
jgi:catechol 2,3-dioxygenase